MDYGLTTNVSSFEPANVIIVDQLVVYFFIGIVVILTAMIGVRILRKLVARSRFHDHVIFLVRLPKDRPGDERKETGLQQLREEIARGETLFASIGGLRAEWGPKSWLLGRNDHFSFEIVANKKLISFYVIAPRTMSRYIEQQVHAHYPEAVIEEVEDYNIFQPQSAIVTGYVRTKRSAIFPIKTYNRSETDPLNTLVNVMSKLTEHEGMAIQYVVRPAKPGWHRKGAEVARNVRKGKTIREAVSLVGPGRYFTWFWDLVKTARPETPAEKQRRQYNDPMPRLTAMEEEMLKGIEEKNSKAGLEVNIRVIASAANRGSAQAYVNNIMSAFSQYNYYEYGNNISYSIITRGYSDMVNNFIYRRFDPRIRVLLNTEELTSMFHLPLRGTETPNIRWLTARHAPAPENIPDEGIILGSNVYRGSVRDIRIKRDDRRRHMYILGKSGTGKSFFQTSMAVQDILNGEGVCVIDPHGDLISDILPRIPPERAEDVILFAPADIDRPLALNLLEFDVRYPEQKTFVINEMINIFDKLYDLKQTGGPIFEQYMRNAMLLVMSHPESGSTLMEIPKVLANPEFRRMKLEKCPDPTVVDFWKQEAEKAGGDAALANVVPYITSKLTQFISNDTMRPIIGQQKSSFNLRDVMDKGKILLVNLSKGQVGEMNAYLLGMILVGKMLMAALSRTDMAGDKRRDFYLYIDEFQNFTTDSICSILSEARKYALNLIIAHQYIGQLVTGGNDTSIRDAVFGNAGTWITFKVGSDDAEVLEKEYSPVFNKFDLINIEKFTAYVKLLIDNTAARPFSMRSIAPLPGLPRDEIAAKIKTLSRLKYGQDRKLIEAEIMRRTRVK